MDREDVHRKVINFTTGVAIAIALPLAAEESDYSHLPSLGDAENSGALLSFYPESSGGDLLDGLQLASLLTFLYDTNPGQAPGTQDAPEEGSAALIVMPTLSWIGESRRWRTELNAKAGLSEYLKHAEYSGASYSIGATAEYDGGRWDLVSRFRHAYTDGVNRYYADSVSQVSYGAGMDVSFDLSPKTSISFLWDSSWTLPDGDYGETESHVGSVSALWKFSSLLRFGPGIAIKTTGGEIQQSRDSVGPMISAVYQVSKKVSITGVVGMDFTEYDDGNDDTYLSSRLIGNYEINRLWSLNLAFVRSAEADGSVGAGFRETTGVRVGVQRKIRRITAGLGVGFEHSDYLNSAGRSARADVDYFTGDLSLSFPIWNDRMTGAVFLRGQESGSEDVTRDWQAIQSGLSFSLKF